VNATHAIEVDEIQTTRGEKALAVVLGLFLLVGLVWGYTRLDTRVAFYDELPPALSPADQAAINAHADAQAVLVEAQADHTEALGDLQVKRERYRTALDAGRPAPGLETEYREAERTYAATEKRLAAPQARVARTEGPAAAARERQADAFEAKRTREEQITFALRLVYVLVLLAAAYGLLHVLRGSRYFPLGIAAVVAAAVLTLVFTSDYVEDRVDWRDTGPVVLSLAGIALTLGAFWGLQRYLQRRIPLRRVRKGKCPFCGFPAAGNTSCEGCGRAVAGSCSHCGEHRRVGVTFCGSCGKP
jgi:hypothetical protein